MPVATVTEIKLLDMHNHISIDFKGGTFLVINTMMFPANLNKFPLNINLRGKPVTKILVLCI